MKNLIHAIFSLEFTQAAITLTFGICLLLLEPLLGFFGIELGYVRSLLFFFLGTAGALLGFCALALSSKLKALHDSQQSLLAKLDLREATDNLIVALIKDQKAQLHVINAQIKSVQEQIAKYNSETEHESDRNAHQSRDASGVTDSSHAGSDEEKANA